MYHTFIFRNLSHGLDVLDVSQIWSQSILVYLLKESTFKRNAHFHCHNTHDLAHDRIRIGYRDIAQVHRCASHRDDEMPLPRELESEETSAYARHVYARTSMPRIRSDARRTGGNLRSAS